MLRRLRRGKNIVTAHRSRLYHRLVIAGASPRSVTLLVVVMDSAGAGLARLWYRSHDSLARVFGVASLCVVFYVFVNYMERSYLK